MRTIIILLLVAIIATLAITAQEATKGATFGQAPDPKAKTVWLTKAVAKRTFDAPLSVRAMVKEVCQKKGCWMILTDGKSSVRVTFKDYGFFVPKDLAGHLVVVEGVLSEEVLTEDEARHYAEDAGKTKREIDKIKGDQRELSFEATGVRIVQ